MTTVDELWYRADQAARQAEQTYHRLADSHADYLEFETRKHVSRRRFRTVTARIRDNGLPYGAHTLAYRGNGDLALVRHQAVAQWVLPGGETHDGEDFREAAARELAEEAGIEAAYDGLGLLGRVEFSTGDHATWGVLPVYEAAAGSSDLTVSDPDGEITAARWFDELPDDTRDREQLREWRRHRFD